MTEKGEFEKQMMKEAEITPCRGHAYTVKTCDLLEIFNEARKGFITFDTARRLGERITKLKGKKLIRWAEAYANAKNEKWAKRWFGDKK